MALILGLLIICVVVAILVVRRRSRERKEDASSATEDLQALMERDLQMLTKQTPMAEPETPDTLHSDSNTAMVHAMNQDAADQKRNAPIVHHDEETEELFLLWDDTMADEPLITVAPDGCDPNLSLVFMDGDLVAQVSCKRTIQAEDIGLMPISAAQSMGLIQRAA